MSNWSRELDEACLALSFCYRQPIRYYEIEYVPEDSHFRSHSVFRSKFAVNRRRHDVEELIDARNLARGGLARLMTSIRSAPQVEGITRAIEFLSASYEGAFAEVGYFLAFSAMETIVNACLTDDEKEVVTGRTWRKLERASRDCIKTNGQSLGVDPNVLGEICDKLLELKRPSILARIKKACGRYQPKVDDLWPVVGFEAGITGAAQARNFLFHDATSSSPLGDDLVRIQEFSERLLVALLAWPTEKQWVWRDQRLKWVNAQPS